MITENKYAKTILATAALLTMMTGVSAELDIQPSEFEENLQAGETIVQPLNITWSGEVPEAVLLDSTVTKDGVETDEGFNISFEHNPVGVQPAFISEVEAEIQTSPSLQEGSYSIDIEGEVTQQKAEDSSLGSGSTSSLIIDTETMESLSREEVLELNQTLHETKDEKSGLEIRLEEVKDDREILKNETRELVQERDDLNQTSEALDDRLESIEERERRNRLLAYLMTALFFTTLLGLGKQLGYGKKLPDKIRGFSRPRWRFNKNNEEELKEW